MPANTQPNQPTVFRALTLPHFASPANVTSLDLSNDADAATAQTIGIMRRLVLEDAAAPAIRAEAARLIGPNPKETARRIFWEVKRRARYRSDAQIAAVHGLNGYAEILIRPGDLVKMTEPQGDCDDFAMLTAALLIAAGVPASFATIAANPRRPREFSHVYTVAHLPCGPYPLDTSHGPRPGWEAPGQRRKTWRIAPMPSPLAGLGQAAAPWWQTATTSGINATLEILKARYGNPPAGVSFQTTPQGTSYSRQDPNAPFTYPSGFSFGNSGLLWVGGAILAVALLSKVAKS